MKAEFLEIAAFNEAVGKREQMETEMRKVAKKKGELMVKLNKMDASKASVTELAAGAKPGSNVDKLKQMMD